MGSGVVADRYGPYEIVAALSAGGMGEVYRARDTRIHRDVALKILPAAMASDPERRRRFLQVGVGSLALLCGCVDRHHPAAADPPGS